jgi:hypothetical protein
MKRTVIIGIGSAVRRSAPPGILLRRGKGNILRHHALLRIDPHSPALGYALLLGGFALAKLSREARSGLPALMETLFQAVRTQGVSVTLLRAPRVAQAWRETAA